MDTDPSSLMNSPSMAAAAVRGDTCAPLDASNDNEEAVAGVGALRDGGERGGLGAAEAGREGARDPGSEGGSDGGSPGSSSSGRAGVRCALILGWLTAGTPTDEAA